jgi:hypothetical protein
MSHTLKPMNLKSELRVPEGRKKAEARSSNLRRVGLLIPGGSRNGAPAGVRTSDFGLLSVFGFRPSELRASSRRAAVLIGAILLLARGLGGEPPAATNPPPAPITLEGFQLVGELSDERAVFTLTATAKVSERRGGTLDLLSGSVALTEVTPASKWRVRAGSGRFALVLDQAGEFPIRLQFTAAVRPKNGWNELEFAVAPAALQPVVLRGLPPDAQIEFPGAAKPERSGTDFVSYLPSDGRVKLAWKTTKAEAEGKLFYSAESLAQVVVSPGLMRQTAWFDFRVMQGELKRVVLALKGDGEVTRVQGAQVLAWAIEPGPGGSGRRMIVQLNQPQKDQFALLVQMQTPLGAFPQAVDAVQLSPEDATRFGGHVRVVNEGAVRLEVVQASGLSQIAPEQFPQGETSRALFGAPANQVFAYRFSGAGYQLRLQADNVLPEVGVSQLVLYHLGETELAIEAELELDVREAPLRELLLVVPRGFALARLNASGLSDYFVTDQPDPPASQLRLVYASPVVGRQVVQLRLERNQPWQGTSWALPRLEVVKAKSVRGHVGVSADAGFRLAPGTTQGLTDIATAFFPRQVPGLQAAFRLSDPAWQGSVSVERIAQSIQADVFHLFSIGEGVAYGSSLMNYLIAGAPVAALKVELSGEYFNVEFTGKDIRNWQKVEGGYQVQLHTPVSGAYTLLATYERPFKAQGDRLTFTGARPADAQSEQGHTIVISTYQFQVKPVEISAGLLPLETGEVPAPYRLFFDAPILAAYHYTARPFQLQLELDPLVQGETLNQVVDRAALTTRISEEGQVLTDARYFIKSKGAPHFRLTLPRGLRLWSALVNGTTVVPVLDDQANLVPLPPRADPNSVNVLELKLARTSSVPQRVTVAAPIVAAPVLLTEWQLIPETGRRLSFRKGSLTPTAGLDDVSGFAGLARLVKASGGLELFRSVGTALALFLASALVWRWAGAEGTTRYSPRHLAGAVIGLLGCILGLALLLQLAQQAQGVAVTSPTGLQFVAPVQQAGSALNVEVNNLRAEPSVWAMAWTVWPALLGLAIWIAAWVTPRGWLQSTGGVLGWTLMLWAALRWPNGTAAFFGVGAGFILWHVMVPSLRRLWQLPPRAEVNGAAAALPLLALGCLLGLNQPAVAESSTNAAGVADSALIQVRVQDDFAFVTAKIQWPAKRGQVLPLLQEPAVLTGLSYASNALQLVSSTAHGKPSSELVARKNGTFELGLQYQLRIQSRDGESGFILPTQPGLINRLHLELVGQDMDLRAPTAVSVQREPGTNGTVVDLVLSPVAGAWIGWKPRDRDTRQEKAVFYAEMFQLFVPTPGVVEGIHQVQIRPAQGELTELVFDVPAGTTIIDVLDAATTKPAAEPPAGQVRTAPPVVSLWRFDPDTRKLRVTLSPAQARPFGLILRAQIATRPLPYEQSARLISVNQAAGQVVLVGIATGSEVQLNDVQADGFAAINLEDFPAAELPLLANQVPGLAVRRAFRQAGPDPQLVMKAASVEPDVRVESQETLSLGEDRTVLAANLAATITRAGIFKLSFVLPPALDVESISGPALSHWTELKTDSGRVITLHLKGKVEGQQAFAITLAGPGVKPSRDWSVPRLVLREAGKHRGQLVVVPEQGLRLQVGSREGVTQLDPAKAGIRQKGVLAFRLLEGDWRLGLDLERVDAWIQVTSLQHVLLTEAQAKIIANLEYQVENTGVRALVVRLPANAEGVRFKGDQVSDFVAREGEPAPGLRDWEVKLNRRVIGKYPLQVSYTVRVPEQAKETTVVGVQAQEVNLQRGFVALRTAGRLQIRPGVLPGGLQPTEWQAIPRSLHQDLDTAAANFAFRVVEPAFQLPVELERHEAAKLLPARVNRVALTSVISGDGVALTRAELELVPGDKRLLRVTLPPEARFWFAFVNQGSVWPWRETNQILIPLERNSKVGTATTVELVYSGQAGRAAARSLDLQLLGPRFDLPLENISWRVFLGEPWRLRRWTGTLQLQGEAADASSTTVDLETYIRSEAGFLQSKTKEAEQLLSMANTYLEKGDPQQARRAFQAAYGLSQHDNAFNEDARVQLHNLKMQQALVGLNVRQSALGGDAPGARLRESVGTGGDKTPTYTQDEAKRLLDANSAEENAVQMRLAERMIQQQDAAVANPAAIRASIPEQGRVLTFSRALLVDPWAEMKIGIQAGAVRTASPGLKTLVLLALFALLGFFGWLTRGRAAAGRA